MSQPAASGEQLLDELHAVLTRYVILPSAEACDAVVAWIAATHAQPLWEAATRLVVKSPEKRCGKSRLIDLIEATCHKPLLTVNISPAALVRSIGEDPPTLLLDEADTVFGKKVADNHEDLRGIVNAGHQRGRPYIRWDASARTTEQCPTFAMAALAGIGSMPDTIEDRAVIISMRRRAPNEKVAPYRRRDAPALHDLRDRIAMWLSDIEPLLSIAQPDVPVEDRAADTWEPLIAIADAAGGTWPARIRGACVVLTEQSETDTSLGIRLLADLRTVFGSADAKTLHTGTIIAELKKLDESPWPSYFGRELLDRDIANLLKPYGVRSCNIRIGGSVLKGYRVYRSANDDSKSASSLHEAWSRYLPDLPDQAESATSATSVTAQVSDHDQVACSGQPPLHATSTPALTSGVTEVADVAHTPQRHEDDAVDLLGRDLGARPVDDDLSRRRKPPTPAPRPPDASRRPTPGGDGPKAHLEPSRRPDGTLRPTESCRQCGKTIDPGRTSSLGGGLCYTCDPLPPRRASA